MASRTSKKKRKAPARKAAPSKSKKKSKAKAVKKKAKAAPKKKASAKKTAARKAPVKKAPKAKKPAAKKKKKQTVGEGDYAASRTFLRDQAGFVQKNKAKIPAMGKAAETALEGPEGDALRAAEAQGLARSRDTF